MVRIAGLITVALLAALVAVQTLAAGTGWCSDARLPALARGRACCCGGGRRSSSW